MNLQITPKPIRILHKLYDHAVSVADPMLTVPSYLPEKPRGRVIVVGAGKRAQGWLKRWKLFGVPVRVLS